MKPENTPWICIYHANRWRCAFFHLRALGLVTAAGGCVATPMQDGGRFGAVALLPAAMIVAGARFSCLAGTRPRLEITPEGIRVHTLSTPVATPWSNVAGVHPKFLEHGLVTRESMEGKEVERMVASAGSSDKYPKGIRSLVAARRFMPLMPFSWHLLHGGFVALVQQLAPQIDLPLVSPRRGRG